MAEKKDGPKMVPVDIQGKPLPNLTEEQYAKKAELEYERLMASSNKGIYNTWTREEKSMLVKWAQKNYDTSISEFKDIVTAFIERNPLGGNIALRSWKKPSPEFGRILDVTCMHCARMHSFDVPVDARGWWEFEPPCVVSLRPSNGVFRVWDDTPIAKWETKLLEDELEKGLKKK